MKNTKVLIIFSVLIIALGIFAFMKPSTYLGTTPSPTTRPAIAPGPEILSSASISIKDSKFAPGNISVKKGTLVTWKNDDSVAHSVTSGKDFSSRLVSPGSVYSHSFNSVGVFKYNCSIHPAMTGTVTVTE